MSRLARPFFLFGLLIQVVSFASASETLAPYLIPSTSDKYFSYFLLKKFYEGRNAAPAWFENNQPTRAIKDLLNAIKQADREGLKPTDYHLQEISDLLSRVEEESTRTDADMDALELLLTDAFLTYGSDLVSGRTNPYDVDDDWFAGRRTGNLPESLEQAFDKGDIRQMLRDLLPKHPVYERMRDALARYRQIEKNGGWPEIPKGPGLKLGDRNPRLVLLRSRLYIERDLNQKPNKKELFDPTLQRGLKHFQARMGLEPDGVLGEETRRILNITVKQRIQQIEINMERCRWLPDDLGKRYIFVNIPSFTLKIIENNRETMGMRVVVGRKMRQTPVFSSTMTHVIFNPPWSVPPKVARMDILDHIREEPDYLMTHNFEVFNSYEEGATSIDPTTINWSSVTAQNLKYKFRQKSGPLNALGRIKFLLPNAFDVYLHDTPSRSLFSKTTRDFSSGCIRLEKPVELANYVLGGDAHWTTTQIEAAINKNTEQVIPLPEKIPVHLMYLTSWVDDGNNVQFRDDIYGRDTALIQAIVREPAL